MKSLSSLRSFSGVISLAWVVLASSAQAAPATSDELNGAPEQEKTTTPSQSLGQDPTRAPLLPSGTGVQQSTTVELLLQLQDRPNLLGAEGQKNASELRRTTAQPGTGTAKPGAEPPAEDANPLLNLKEMVLGPAKPRSNDGDPREPDEGVGQAQRFSSDSGQPHRSGARSGSSDPGESLLSNPVVRFIRENRGLTISVSIAVLVGIWLTANFSIRRGR